MVINVLWEAGTFLLILIACLRAVPQKRIREACVSFLSMQVFTWGLGTVIVNFHWKVHPVRLFAPITRQDFANDFFIYPLVSVLYYFHYPKGKPKTAQVWYTLFWAGAVGLWDFGMDTLTDLEQYIHWNAVIHFMLAFVLLRTCYAFTTWFFKRLFPSKEGVEVHGQR